MNHYLDDSPIIETFFFHYRILTTQISCAASRTTDPWNCFNIHI